VSHAVSHVHLVTQVRRGALEDAHRERDVLVQGLARAGDKARSALEVVAWQVSHFHGVLTIMNCFCS
jgi:hypothetical protein